MRELGKIAVYCVAVVVCGALLAPPSYVLGQWAITTDALPQLRPFGFEKYLNRAVMVSALVALWPLLRWLRVRHWQDLGLRPNPRRVEHVMTGVALGAGGLFFVAALLWRHQILHIHRSCDLRDVLGAAGVALIVALLEEAFFRGALFGVLRRRLPVAAAAAALSMFFACLHFIRSDPSLGRVDDPRWWSGFALLPRLLWQFQHRDLIVGTWATLFVMGCTLAYTVWRTQSLYLAIGLHMGWVFALKLVTVVSRSQGPNVWVGDDLRQGLAPLILMLLTWVCLVVGLRLLGQPGGRASPGGTAWWQGA